MATTMTLTELQTASLQRADMVNSQFIATAELTSYINQSYFELYDLLVSSYGDDYFVKTPYTFTTDGTSQLFALPSDFYKLLGVDLQLQNNQPAYVSLKPFAFSERNRYSIPNYQSLYGPTNLRYRLQASSLWLSPIPASGQTIQLWYVPKLTTLVNSNDTADGISGWTEYIICDVAIKCMQKQESDVSTLMAQKQGLIDRIKNMAANRDAGSSAAVADVRTSSDWFPTGQGEIF